METSRDRVIGAIDHVQPEVVPVHIMGFDDLDGWRARLGARDYLELRSLLGLDVQGGLPVYVGSRLGSGPSVWGTGQSPMGAGGSGYGSSRGGYPLSGAATTADIERFEWPSADEFDFGAAAAVMREIGPEAARWLKLQAAWTRPGTTVGDAARGPGEWMPVLCTLFDLFGMEDALIRLRAEPAIVEAALEHVEAFLLEYTRRMLEAAEGMVDIVWFGDDFASQRGLLVSPEDWRRFLKPTYGRLFELAKGHGARVWFHACGTFGPVLPDLIDLGMDVWETVQVHAPGNDPTTLKREYGRDIAFCGAISSQGTLPFGTPADVRAEVRERIQVLGRGGGYICGGDHSVLPDVPADNVLAMLDEAKRFTFRD